MEFGNATLRAMLIAVMGGMASLAWAGPIPCGDPGFQVDTSDAATHDMICGAASDAREALATCGLTQIEPIDIETVDTPVHNIGECLAAYDCKTRRIQIIEPLLLDENIPADDPYANLPSEVVFRSLLTHELAHALVDQNTGDHKIPMVDHEYIANALELATLRPRHREILLDAAGIEAPIHKETIDIFIYGLAPRRFAAASYLYFEAHGCKTVTGVLDGTVTFQIEY